MYGRHRSSSSSSSAGNGYRSNAVGQIGIPGSRVSPEAASSSSSSIRNYARPGYSSEFSRDFNRNFNSNFNNFNRNFGRGSPKPLQSSQPPLTPTGPPPLPPALLPPKRGQLLFEAGRLAVDYLIAHGLLSSDLLLATKTQNQTHSKNGSGADLHGHLLLGLQPGEEIIESSFDAAVGSPDVASRRRQSPDKYSSGIPVQDCTSFGSSRNNTSEQNRQNGRVGPSFNMLNGSSIQDTEPNSDDSSALHHTKDVDGEFDISVTNNAEFVSNVDKSSCINEEARQDQPSGHDLDTASHSARNLPIKIGDGVAKDSDDNEPECVHQSGDNQTDHDLGEVLGDQQCQEEASTKSSNHLDLLKLCNPCNVPTKTRSSLINKGLKTDIFSTGVNSSGCARQSSLSVLDNSDNCCKAGSFSSPSSTSQPLGSDSNGDRVAEDVGRLGSPLDSEPEIRIDTRSSPEGVAIHEHGPQQTTSQLANFSSLTRNNSGKRAMEGDCATEVTKKAKGWSSIIEKQDILHLLDSGGRWTSSLQGKDSSAAKSLLKKCSAESSAEEKQIFSNSFKICDLNLLESSDANEVHDDSVRMYSSTSAPNKEAAVEIDLSMSNNCGLPNEYPKFGAIGKDIELIDLEDDSLQGANSFHNSTSGTQAELKSSESFQNRAHNLSESTHAQDGYGLMISELIGTDMQDCSSVQLRPDISPSHNDMSLHHGEGLLNDDDQIFMSLGEIPLSFLQVWEQPTQDYEKPF